MTDSPRWERESHEDLRPSTPQPEAELGSRPPLPFDTVEFTMGRSGESDGDGGLAEPQDPPEFEPREPRLAAARESLAATRESVGESLAATRDSVGESLASGRESFVATAGRVGRWFGSLDRRPEFDPDAAHDPVAELTAPPAERERAPSTALVRATETLPDEPRQPAGEHRFPTAALGYNRQAVDSQLALLESELARLREIVDPPVSINEEIERLGEQTASILVVAHDKAHETARRAQEQASRAVSEAADDAERITVEAQRRLRELDEETDAVWRERERLLDDVREVSATLATLADSARERFPAAEAVAAVEGPAGT